MNPISLATSVCLAMAFVSPAKAHAAPPLPAVSVAIVAPPAAVAMTSSTSEAPTVHVVLNRGRQRLELDLPRDGKVTPDVADAIAEIMADPNSGRRRRIATGTLVLLADVVARFPGHEIDIISAVRSEPERKRDGIKHSKHWSGHAIDLAVRDVKLTTVRDTMWMHHHDIGVGYYPDSGFVHIDYRPDIHDTAWTQPRRNADYVYNPRWSRAKTEGMNVKQLFASVAKALGFTHKAPTRDRRSS
jgi:uncharacterized protein YcbK (DUF882 family)